MLPPVLLLLLLGPRVLGPEALLSRPFAVVVSPSGAACFIALLAGFGSGFDDPTGGDARPVAASRRARCACTIDSTCEGARAHAPRSQTT